MTTGSITSVCRGRASYTQASWREGKFRGIIQGLEEALGALGGAPAENRTDSLSAAFKNLAKDQKEDMTRRYRELCAHYGMEATRNNRGSRMRTEP